MMAGEDRDSRMPNDANGVELRDRADETSGDASASVITKVSRRPFDLFQDPVSRWLLLVAIVLDLVMIVVTYVARDQLGPAIALHWSVNGLPDRIGLPREIWIIPLISSLVVAANVILGWLAFQYDRFLSRFLLGATWLVELTGWIALITLIR